MRTNAKHSNDDALLAQYISTFEKLDYLDTMEVSDALCIRSEEAIMKRWKSRHSITPPSTLSTLYKELGLLGSGATRFPPLYEALILAYRWAEVDLDTYRLYANDFAKDFSPLSACMRRDKVLYATLVPNGYFPFGKGADVDYDPVCFDFRQRQNNGDCRIVKLDHEAILCYGDIGEITELAPNFRTLVQDTIRRADLIS